MTYDAQLILIAIQSLFCQLALPDEEMATSAVIISRSVP